jgi:hypothetical protein
MASLSLPTSRPNSTWSRLGQPRSSARLIDAVSVWGDVDAIGGRVSELLQAGADQVALSLISDPGPTLCLEQWRRLAEALIR